MRRAIYEDDVIKLLDKGWKSGVYPVASNIHSLPSAQSERTEYIPDTKAVRSKRDCVDLAERVTATFYDQEHEEWTQQTVTIADVLDSVCDEYTVLPSAQPEITRCKDCKLRNKLGCPANAYIPEDSELYCAWAERRTDEE